MPHKTLEGGDTGAPTPGFADTRRDQVLRAASQCVCERGFHAATVLRIAREARMSAGNIYRYFRNKEAIVAALVEQRLGEKQECIERIAAASPARGFMDTWIAQFDASPSAREQADSIALDLEILAESGRNSDVAQQVHQADLMARSGVIEALKSLPALDQMSPCELDARLAVMNILLEGLTIRNMCDSSMDRVAVRRVTERIVRMLLAGVH